MCVTRGLSVRLWWSLDFRRSVSTVQSSPNPHPQRPAPSKLAPRTLVLTPQLFPPPPSSEANSKWLDAHYDPMANIHTFSACLGESLEPGILGSGEKEESDNGSVVKPLGF